MTDRGKLLERLRKLFALGTSNNPHEAELALAKANELMREHQIGLTDIDMAAEGAITEEDEIVSGSRGHMTILGSLSNAAALLYDARVGRVRRKGCTAMRYRFFGTPTDVAAARMTFTHLYQSWRSIVDFDIRAARKVGTLTRAYRISHGIGFGSVIYERVSELVRERSNAVKTATGRDLVVVKNAALDDYVGDRMRKGRKLSLSNYDPQAASTGKERGAAVPLSGGIEGHDPQQLIGAR